MRRTAILLAFLALVRSAAALPGPFTDVTAEAGVSYQHGWTDPTFDDRRHVSGGVACGDYDGDGWLDLYVVRGDIAPSLLFHNERDGTFEEVGITAGVAIGGAGSGPTFADQDGDGLLDLLVLGVAGTKPRLFRNRGDGTFADVTATSGLDAITRASISAAFGDPDRDGDLDLLITHWANAIAPGDAAELYWRNDGGRYVEASADVGIRHVPSTTLLAPIDLTFTPNFADMNGDGWPDVLMAADYGTSRVYLNDGTGRFTDVTTPVISDENGMGSAIGDYDEDGDLDWFVSSIWDPNGDTGESWFTSGNRLYRNRGDATFDDVTDAAGVREGYWGWASTFADLDADGHLDLFHVNGWYSSEAAAVFLDDPSRLFAANGDGTFTEVSAAAGIVDTGLGRGTVAFDYDRDGDLDLFVADNDGPGRLFRNDHTGSHFLTVKLRGPKPNTDAVGAQVWVDAGGTTQLRELRAGSNYVSQDPTEAHFGLGAVTTVDAVRVRWPDGTTTSVPGGPADRFLVVEQPEATCTAGGCVPGGGKAKQDCLLQAWVGASKLRPCTEGDPSCDLDPDTTDGTCQLRLALCTGTTLKRCEPRAVDAVTVLRPSGADQTGAAFAALAGRLALPAPFTAPSGERCTSTTGIPVPLRRRRNGKVGAGKVVVQLEARGADGARDVDRFVLTCRP